MLTVSPISFVGDREESDAVERVLHHAGQVQRFGGEFRPPGAVLSVRLRKYRRLVTYIILLYELTSY